MYGSILRGGTARGALLLASLVVMLGWGGVLASDDPLETPLYDQEKTRAVESMDAASAGDPTAEAGEVGAENGIPKKTTKRDCRDIPTLSTEGTIVLIVALIGTACWLILRRKSSDSGAA